MQPFTLAALATLAIVNCHPVLHAFGLGNAKRSVSAGGNSTCISGTFKIPVTATNLQILKPAPPTNREVTELYVELSQVNSTVGASAVGGPQSVNGTYGIYVQLCFPSNEAAQRRVTTVQLLTHGGTLDRTYWDIAPGYSYVDAATLAGYATLSYDRLGTGFSDHPDPLQTVQLPLQVELAHIIVQNLRNASMSDERISVSKIVGVGHSLGGALTQAVAAKYPKDFDALIIQGTAAVTPTVAQYASTGVASEAFQIANTDPSGRFNGLADGYHVSGPLPQTVQFAFYRYPGFDPKIFSLQAARKQTLALGESYTLPFAYAPATAYTGPVAIVNGQNDWFYCGGDCTYPVDQAAAAIPANFPNADKERSTSYLAPGAGHSVNAHLAAGKAFDRMITFLEGALGGK
ncbi:MAG: hypothetical protein LQ344_000752 [Seirophora lacunosa]|nr:MAG: hypothetical protein LQ344_000752 [Seirophora lacunosa]